MMNDISILLRFVGQTITDPAEMAAKVKLRQDDPQTLWSALALLAILNVLATAIMQAVLMSSVPLPDGVVSVTPISYGIIMVALSVTLVFSTFYAGNLLGGSGTLRETLALVVWLQVVGFVIHVAEILVFVISPLLAGVLSLIGLAVVLRCAVNFVNVLHQFENMGKTALTIIMASVASVLIAGIILSLMGVSVPGGTI